MSFLFNLNRVSIILVFISLVYTIYHIVLRIQLKKIQEELVSFIITMIQRKFSDQEILNILHQKGFELEEIQNRINELRQLTSSFIKESDAGNDKPKQKTMAQEQKPIQQLKTPQRPAEQVVTSPKDSS